MVICKCQMVEFRRAHGCDANIGTNHVIKKYIKLFENDQQMEDYVREVNRQNNKFNIRVYCYKLDNFECIYSITMEDCMNNTLPEIMEIFNTINMRNGDKKVFPKI